MLKYGFLLKFTPIFVFRALTLKTAIEICTQIKDCGGITKVKMDYEIRGGKAFVKSEEGEESWVNDKPLVISNKKLKSLKQPEYSNCVPMPSSLLNEEQILKENPKLRKEKNCGKDGFYHYNEKFGHLNSLLKDGRKYFLV